MADQSSGFETSREHIVEIARTWLGTPYIHQASLKGVGCDCLGLLRGVWKDLYNQEAETPPPYTPVWAEMVPSGQEPMLEAAHRHLKPKAKADMLPGDVLLIRILPKGAIMHCGIVAPNNHIIHAYDRHCVIEEPIREAWKTRNLFVFEMPGVTK